MAKCWCGNLKLEPFSPDYGTCGVCGTLVSRHDPAQPDPLVCDDASDFYGKEYWLSRQQAAYGLPSIHERARQDLPERCTYWLNALMRLKAPPARVLELGSAHGGFVALMRAAGYDATGLELSPAIVQLAKAMFGVPVLAGPIENQRIAARSLDAIVIMDVLEHLPDPLRTIRVCATLLKPDGVIVVQTPCYEAGLTWQEMIEQGNRFLHHLQPGEHLNLFTRASIARLFATAGLGHTHFLTPIFWFYDLFAVASMDRAAVQPFPNRSDVPISGVESRLVQALLDGEDRFRDLLAKHRQAIARLRDLDQPAKCEHVTTSAPR